MDSALRRLAKDHTPARVYLGTTGVSLSTRALLEFQMDQAQARDAVEESLATPSLIEDLAVLHAAAGHTAAEQIAWSSPGTLTLQTAAASREIYLRRPDLGRRLAASRAATELRSTPCDLVIVLADGLSALALNRHALPLLRELFALFATANRAWTLGPFCLVEQGRVAVGDEIGERMGAEMVLMLIGERPGLSAPDSLGAYITWQPRIGRTDAERNCISNIRPEGLSYVVAAQRIFECLATAARLRLTGVELGRQLALEEPLRSGQRIRS